MPRLLTLAVPLVLALGASGCVAHSHHHYPVEEAPTEYPYTGHHPVPHDHGGGWCMESHHHVHVYSPGPQYVYVDRYYAYRGPTVVWYVDLHPNRHGGYCNLHGRHSHDYFPTREHYSWDRGRNVYVYNRRHEASPGQGWSRPAPSNPGHGYRPPSILPVRAAWTPSTSPLRSTRA